MGNRLPCSFQAACMCFREALCFSTSIDSKECGGPTIRGLKIVAVANISSGSHKIAIISQCSKCNKIWGVVTGDTEPIPYKADAVVLTDKMREKIPQVTCKKCLEHPSHGWIALDITAQQPQASTTT